MTRQLTLYQRWMTGDLATHSLTLRGAYRETISVTLVDMLDETLTGTNAETLGDTQGDVETPALVDTLAHILAEARPTELTTHWLM